MRTETKVEFWYPGSFVSESESVDIEHRDPHKVDVPKGAFAFKFFDVEVQTATLEDGSTFENRKRVNESPTFYPGATALTVADVASLPGDHEILMANMRCNGWDKVIRTRRGNYQPFEAEKTVLV